MPQIFSPQSLNRYSYVINNPLRLTDPSGHTYLYTEEDDPPPVTIDDENGLCIMTYCSGTIESNLETIEKNFNTLGYNPDYPGGYDEERGLCLPQNWGCSGKIDFDSLVEGFGMSLDYLEAAGVKTPTYGGFILAAAMQANEDSNRTDISTNEKTMRAMAVALEDTAVSAIGVWVGTEAGLLGVGLLWETGPVGIGVGWVAGFGAGHLGVVGRANQVLPIINQNYVFPAIHAIDKLPSR